MPAAGERPGEAPSRVVLRRPIRVGLPPARALHAFTPVGERLWADGWDPAFPAGEVGDGAEVGTAFVTGHGAHATVWVVVEHAEHTVRYARVTPGLLAGTVAVRCQADGSGGTLAEVTYDLTALTAAGRAELAGFAEAYDEYLAAWAREIAAALDAGRLG
jgi:hypothetical protein